MHGGKPREHQLSTQEGYQTLRIESVNPDTFITPEAQLQVIQNLQQREMQIAAIQETHKPHDQNFKRSGYRITTSKAIQQEKGTQGVSTGGLAILIHEELEHRISHIHRIDHRILKITLQSRESHTPITIITT